MITATVEDTQMGKWTVLECQHPVKSGRHLILGGKFRTRTKLLTTCGQRFYLGPMTQWDELADKLEEHVKTHDRGGNDPGDPDPEDQGHGREPEAVVSGPADLGSYRETLRGHRRGDITVLDGGDQEGSGESPGES